MKKIKKTITKTEFSKRCILFLLFFTCAELVLITIFRPELEGLAKTLVGGLGVEFTGYLLRAYFGKKNEENNKIKEKRYDYYFREEPTYNDDYEITNDEGEY